MIFLKEDAKLSKKMTLFVRKEKFEPFLYGASRASPQKEKHKDRISS